MIFAVITQLILQQRLLKAIVLFILTEPKAPTALGLEGADLPVDSQHLSSKRQPHSFDPVIITDSGLCLFACCGSHIAFSLFFFFLQIFYRVVADIEPGEELLLFMKSEDYSHETMAPDIHG